MWKEELEVCPFHVRVILSFNGLIVFLANSIASVLYLGRLESRGPELQLLLVLQLRCPDQQVRQLSS